MRQFSKQEIARSYRIAEEVKAGTCACDITNPKGKCCLGDVNAVVKRAHGEAITS